MTNKEMKDKLDCMFDEIARMRFAVRDMEPHIPADLKEEFNDFKETLVDASGQSALVSILLAD